MNYRQWKKNYKKRHGVNPPLSEDKRKQRKLALKTMRNIGNIDWYGIASKAAKAMADAMAKFYEEIGNVTEKIGAAFRDMAVDIRQNMQEKEGE